MHISSVLLVMSCHFFGAPTSGVDFRDLLEARPCTSLLMCSVYRFVARVLRVQRMRIARFAPCMVPIRLLVHQ